MNETEASLHPRDIVDFTFKFPAGWYEMPFAAEAHAADWPRTLSTRLGVPQESADGVETQLRYAQRLVAEEDPADATKAYVYIPFPERGVVNGLLTCTFLGLEPDDSPESYLAAVESHADDRSPGYEIRGLQTWRTPHAQGELVGFTHLTALGIPEGDAGEDESVLEQRVGFVLFPVGAAQAVQLVFRSAFIGGFSDMVAETQSIANELRVTLGVSA